jgi:flavin reductase (DIM6/NTAB) family NADH-FMN oxidoreductase RutF
MPRVEIDPVVEALEQFPYGLYIIGSRDGDEVNGMMADWSMQVSFKPRLVAVSLENDASTLRRIRNASVFSVNVLRADSGELARRFCQPADAAKVKGRSDAASTVVYSKLDGVSFAPGERTGCPILAEALAWVECELDQLVPVGDHTLAIGRVVGGAVSGEGEPLTQRILGWSYAG